MIDFGSKKVTVASLRRDAPSWKWSAERGRLYKGVRGAERVEVYAVSRLCGPADDDFATEWRVDDGNRSCSLLIWLLGQCGRR